MTGVVLRERTRDSRINILHLLPFLPFLPYRYPTSGFDHFGHIVTGLDRQTFSQLICFLGGDNVAIGRVAAGFIRECLVAGGRIVEIKGLMTSSPAQERHQGFVEGLGLEATN